MSTAMESVTYTIDGVSFTSLEQVPTTSSASSNAPLKAAAADPTGNVLSTVAQLTVASEELSNTIGDTVTGK